ncbi:MAG: hypothetical protein ABJB10_12965, partial [Mesorhizobium sp.]
MPEAEDSNSIEIPGDTTLWKTQNIPPERVYLPLEAYEKLGWRILGFGFFAAAAGSYAISMYISSKSGWILYNFWE